MKKRALSLLLATVMILSTLVIIPVTAETNTFNANDATPKITTLADLNAFDEAVEDGNTFAGTTIQLAADIELTSDFKGIGTNDGGKKGFGGIFDGQGHTITMNGHTASKSWEGQLFPFLDGSSHVEIKDLNLDGNMNITNGCGSASVLVGRTFASETIIENVHISVDVETSGGMIDTMGVFIYDLRSDVAFENVTLKGCVYDGEIKFNNGAKWVAGFIGISTWGRKTTSLTLQDCIYAGTIHNYDKSATEFNAAFLGDVKSDSVGANIMIKDCYSIGTIDFAGSGDKPSNCNSGVVIGQLRGTKHNVKLENVYYVNIKKLNGSEDDMPLVGALDNGATVTTDNVSAMSKEAIAALTASAFSNTSTMTVKVADEDYAYYPAPAGLVEKGWVASLMVSLKNTFDANANEPVITTLADLEAFDAAIEGGNFFRGKTVKLNGDITLPSDFTGIGVDNNGAKGFGGIFDGQGHTITMSGHGKTAGWTGALFTFTTGDSATIKNLNVDGNMKISSNGTNNGSAVLLGRPLTSEVIIENVHISVDVELATNFDTFGVFIYDLRADTKYTNIEIKGCVYDGTITCKNQASYITTFIGNVQGNQAKPITIKDCVYAGTMYFNDASVSRYSGGFIGDVKSSNNTTININDCYSIGTMKFVGTGTASNDNNGVIFGNISGSTLNVSNFYYVDIQKFSKDENMNINGTGTVTKATNVVAKTKAEIAALTASAFSNDSTMKIGNTNGLNLYYPCPEGLVTDNGWIPSLCYVTGDAAVLGAQIRCTEAGDQYSGIRFVSVFKRDKVEGAQTADANFGIILIAKNNLNNIEGAVTVDSLVAAGGINIQATSADESVDGYYRVNAVVYEISSANYKDEIVAYTYVDGELVGESVTRSIYQVAELCLKDVNATEAQKNFCKTIVPTND